MSQPTTATTAYHTPGPWTVVGDSREEYALAVVIDGDGETGPEVAIIRTEDVSPSQAAADARLIAAAPDMLAVLESLLNSIDEGELRPFTPAFDPDGIRELTRDRISSARHAVARATGEVSR